MRHQVTVLTTLALLASVSHAAAPQAAAPGALPFTITEDTTVVTRPLLPDGTPDYIAALNEKYGNGVTGDNNALVLLLPIRGAKNLLNGSNKADPAMLDKFLELAGAKALPADAAVFESYSEYLKARGKAIPADAEIQFQDAHLKLWTAEENPELAGYLRSQDKFFDMAVEASRRPRYFAPTVASPEAHLSSSASINSFSYAGMVLFGRAWSARAMLRASSGDFDGALADFIAMKKLARLFSPTVLSILLGSVYDNCANESLGVLAASGKLTEAQCSACLKALEMPPIQSLAESRTGDNWSLLDLVIRRATGQLGDALKGSDPQLITMFNSIDVAAVDWDLVLRTIRSATEQEAGVLSAPSAEEMLKQAAAIDALILEWKIELQNHNSLLETMPNESKAAYSERVAHGILTPRNPTFLVQQELRSRDTRLRSAMLRSLLTAAQAKARNGTWPATFAEMGPDTLKQVPIDGYSPQQDDAVAYRVTEKGPAVFSVGPDHMADTPDDIVIGAR